MPEAPLPHIQEMQPRNIELILEESQVPVPVPPVFV
jgi:hypothetical protein